MYWNDFKIKRAKGLPKRFRKGDKVTVMRGQYKKKVGNVTKVLLKQGKVYIEGIEVSRRDGNKAQVPIKPSNIMITSLVLEDRKRKEKVEKKTQNIKEKK